MLSAKNSPLVAGASPGARGPVWVRVLRAFTVGGVVVPAGTERTIDSVLAAELVSANKVERIAAPTPKPAADKPAKKD